MARAVALVADSAVAGSVADSVADSAAAAAVVTDDDRPTVEVAAAPVASGASDRLVSDRRRMRQ